MKIRTPFIDAHRRSTFVLLLLITVLSLLVMLTGCSSQPDQQALPTTTSTTPKKVVESPSTTKCVEHEFYQDPPPTQPTKPSAPTTPPPQKGRKYDSGYPSTTNLPTTVPLEPKPRSQPFPCTLRVSDVAPGDVVCWYQNGYSETVQIVKGPLTEQQYGLGTYFKVRSKLSDGHVYEEDMFAGDAGMEPYSPGSWNATNYLKRGTCPGTEPPPRTEPPASALANTQLV